MEGKLFQYGGVAAILEQFVWYLGYFVLCVENSAK